MCAANSCPAVVQRALSPSTQFERLLRRDRPDLSQGIPPAGRLTPQPEGMSSRDSDSDNYRLENVIKVVLTFFKTLIFAVFGGNVLCINVSVFHYRVLTCQVPDPPISKRLILTE